MKSEPFSGLTLARILRPWGRRGEVAAQILTDFPKRLTKLREVWLSDGPHSTRRVLVRSCRLHIGQAVFHFEGVESIDDAGRLRGLEVQVPLSERTPVGAGRYYLSELIGCTVWEQNDHGAVAAMELGTVADVQRIDGSTSPAPAESSVEAWILAVTTPQGELLVPLASEICTTIDVAGRRIEVRLPEGLRGLNRA